MFKNAGNNVTDNLFRVRNREESIALIREARIDLACRYGWTYLEKPVFSGHFYQKDKIGSHVEKIQLADGGSAILKLQLHPLDYDEGFIYRHIASQLENSRVRIPVVFYDAPWSEETGYGYVVFQDISDFPILWDFPGEYHLQKHADFLSYFLDSVLPSITPWIDIPPETVQQGLLLSHDRFFEKRQHLSQKHISDGDLASFRDAYKHIVNASDLGVLHFTHGHLAGTDIRYDATSDTYYLHSNIFWSYRYAYYEVQFPLWVHMMRVKDEKCTAFTLRYILDDWLRFVANPVYGRDISRERVFGVGLLERAMNTIMLDLGASEWGENEVRFKKPLLEAWKEFFWLTLKQVS